MIQSLVLREQEGEALESVKWLGRQRNSRGGFVSTQVQAYFKTLCSD